MDAHHFDALTRRLSRRLSLGFLSALTLRDLVAPDAAVAKKKCPPCKKRKKGKCKKKLPDGTPCRSGTCQSGRCVATATPPPCQGKADGASCGGIQQCSGGECATPPQCQNLTCIDSGQCCSQNCGINVCQRGGDGKPCNTGADCISNNCVGFRCQAA